MPVVAVTTTGHFTKHKNLGGSLCQVHLLYHPIRIPKKITTK
jgi:hypothetical protein